MLPAHTQEAQSGANSVEPAGEAIEFGKVLTSIHGLQRRLDDFSVDDVSQAETNVYSLIEQISVLQLKLNRLGELKHFVSSTNRLINQSPEENFDQVDVDGLENHPQLHAIMRASKLIRVYKSMKAAKANAESVSFDSKAGELHFYASSESRREPEKIAAVFAPDRALSLEQGKPGADVDEKQAAAMPGLESNQETKSVQHEDWVFNRDAEVDKDGPPFVGLEMPAGSGSEHQSISAAAIAVPKATNFDERLLSDLIQTYGEFSLVPLSPAASNETRPAHLKSAEVNAASSPHNPESERDAITVSAAPGPMQPKLAPPSVLSASVAISDSTNLSSSEAQLPSRVEDPGSLGFKSAAGVLALPSPPVGRPETKKTKNEIASETKNGELDRQLKSIIKDYGEYDLYSHQTSTNMKKAAAVALAVLALVMAFLYFFRTSGTRTDAPASPGRVSPSSSNPSEGSVTAGQQSSGRSFSR